MKATHSQEYFEQYKNDLYAKYHDMCDYESRLTFYLSCISKLDISEDIRVKLLPIYTTQYAQRIADDAKDQLIKKMYMIKRIENGEASLGYTTYVQEISAKHDLVEGFEFSCYMLSEFKKKYSLK